MWEVVTTEDNGPGVGEATQQRSRSGGGRKDNSSQPTKGSENLLLTKALAEGNVAFVWRDALRAPHWIPEDMANGQQPPSASLHSAHYPATLACGRAQAVNRWPRTATLTSKDGSLQSLVAYYSAQSLSPWRFVPLSFQMPNMKLQNLGDPTSCEAWKAFALVHALVARGADPRVECEQGGHNLWLAKPTNSSGGDGISISADLEELLRRLMRARPSAHGFVFQKYIEAPLLYHGRKFDLRLWAVLASDAGSPAGLRVYAYREGYARTSSEPFSLPTRGARGVGCESSGSQRATGDVSEDSATAEADATELRERLVHLTNWCMQVHGEQCGVHEEGNAISFADLEQAAPHVAFRDAVLPRIYALIVDAVLAARRELLAGLREQGGGRQVVQLMGFDIMLTAGGWPFLIECNANPLIAAQSPWHGLLVARMIDDYVQLAADQSFFGGRVPPPQPRAPLDGTHVAQFEGTGFVLLAGRPTEAHPEPLFALTAHNGQLTLQRSTEERQKCEAEGAGHVRPATAPSPPPPSPAASRSKAETNNAGPVGASRRRLVTAEPEAPPPAADARPWQRPSVVGPSRYLGMVAGSLDSHRAGPDAGTGVCTAREPSQSGHRMGDGRSSSVGRRTPVRRRHPSPFR